MEVVTWVVVFFSLVLSTAVEGGGTVYNVVDLGAVGDGKTDDSQKFLSAWSKACGDAGGSPTFLIPQGKTFLLGQIEFAGPCKSNIHVQVLGNIVAPRGTGWVTSGIDNWITFDHVNGLTIDGSGQFDGQGSAWWDCRSKGKCSSLPNALGLMHCDNSRLSGVKFVNGPGKHVILYGCSGATVDGIHISAPESSPNTDGVHVEQCQHVSITGSTIQCGDDCVSIGTGTMDAQITHITCGPGHGISVGSLGRDGSHDEVQQINVSYCGFSQTAHAARIKSWQGGSGFAKDITFEHLTLDGVVNPVAIDQYYCPDHSCPEKAGAVQVSDVSFVDIQGTATGENAISLNCSRTVGCTGVTLRDVTIKQAGGGGALSSVCINAHGTVGGQISPIVPCLQP